DAALQGGFELGGRLDLGAFDALALGQHDKVDLRGAQVHADVLVGVLHLAVVPHVGLPHGLVVQVVRDHGQHRHLVPGLGPKYGGAIHHRAVADVAHHLPVWLGDLRAGGGAHAPAQAGAAGGDPALLVVAIADVEKLVGAAEVFAHDDGVGVEHRIERG